MFKNVFIKDKEEKKPASKPAYKPPPKDLTFSEFKNFGANVSKMQTETLDHDSFDTGASNKGLLQASGTQYIH
jgi:hypothetical protein